jgi:(4-alkanoyl-5-oxo-2,5-dihydrofuran-3-yl)methyl phosphate reductase
MKQEMRSGKKTKQQKEETNTMYLVTGATGNVGSEVVEQLLAGRKKVRVFTRDPGKVAHWNDRVEVVAGDLQQPDTFAQALADVEAIFLMHQGPDLEVCKQLVAAGKDKGNPRIAFLSTILASAPDSQIGKLHKDKEDAIRESGLPGTFVRPGGFMTNLYWWIGTIKTENVVRNPMGTGRLASIAPEDIAAVAVKAMTQDLPDEVFELTGGELLSVPQQVDILAKVLGKPIQCVDVPTETAIQDLLRIGLPAQAAAAIGASFEAIRDGRVTVVKDTVEKVLGRRPMTFETWARRHALRFV